MEKSLKYYNWVLKVEVRIVRKGSKEIIASSKNKLEFPEFPYGISLVTV